MPCIIIANVVFLPKFSSGGVSNITLEQIPSFSTGSTLPPPGGFDGCVLKFSNKDPCPTASTCSMELHLPLQHKCFDDFKEACRVAFTLHGGFGLC